MLELSRGRICYASRSRNMHLVTRLVVCQSRLTEIWARKEQVIRLIDDFYSDIIADVTAEYKSGLIKVQIAAFTDRSISYGLPAFVIRTESAPKQPILKP